jgi:LPS-assembly lipoprotein
LLKRRRIVIGGLSLLATAPLFGCGFRPLLYQADGDNVRSELAAIKINGLGGRLGQHLRTALEDNLNPTSSGTLARYDLDIRLTTTNSALAIQLDNTITRYNLKLTAGFLLRDQESLDILYQSNVERVASYNVRRAPFTTLTAKQDAERRAAKEIADDIRTLLALHFQRRAQST